MNMQRAVSGESGMRLGPLHSSNEWNVTVGERATSGSN